MKKYTKKAFTLVELIVVITILAILATVAFISFGGQTGKAKNSKIVSDLSNIASKVNLLSLEDAKIVKETLSGSTSNTVTGTGAGIALSTAGVYGAGNINFFKLREKKENFQDTRNETPRDYVYSYLALDTVNVFNVAGQTEDDTGAATAIIKGTYYETSESDVDSLVSGTGNTVPVTNNFKLTANSGNIY